MKVRIYLFFTLVCFLIGLQSCEKQKPDIRKKSAPAFASIEKQLKELDLDFQILEKDHPSQIETTPFRLAFNQARQELEAGDLAAARLSVESADAWMKDAQVRYYEIHRKSILDSKSTETGQDLMIKTREFFSLAESHKQNGEMDLFKKYKKAAIEEGELAILAFRVSGSDVFELARATKEQADFLREASELKNAQAMEDQGRAAIQESLDQCTREIRECLSGKSEQCQPDKLKAGYLIFQGMEANLLALADKRRELVEAANQLYPGKISAPELTKEIESWRAEYQSYYEGLWRKLKEQAPPTEDELKREQEGKRLEKIKGLNKICEGASPLGKSGIVIEETEVDLKGKNVMIRGRLYNGSDRSIYEPRVAVCDGVVSVLKDVGFHELQSGMTTSFNLEIFNLTVMELAAKTYRIPPHKLLLVYRDTEGNLHKVYRSY